MTGGNKKNYILLFVWLVFLGVLANFVIFPFWKNLKRVSRELAFQKKAEGLFESRLEDFDNFQEEYSLYQETAEKINASFVAKETPIEFIEFMEKQAAGFGLSIKISPLNLAAGSLDPWIPLGFQVSLKGDFPNFLKFLERLEQSRWLTEIYQLNIERINEDKLKLKEFEGFKVGDISARLNFKVFSGEEPLKSIKEKSENGDE